MGWAMRSGKRTGFTLIEMMIVILIIAILATIVGLAVRNAGSRTKDSTQKAHLQHLNWATLAYQNDTGDYPATLDDLVVPEGSGPPGYHGPYMLPPVPNDPWTDQDYDYDPDTGEVTAPTP